MADKNLLIEIIWDPSPIPVDEKIARSTLVIELPIGVMLGGGGGGGSGGDYIPTSEKGQAGGVAELDDNGKVPASQLPAAQTGDFIPKAEKGQPLGVATLAEDGLVDWRQLPPPPDLSGYVMTWQIGQPNGVAELDSSGMIPAFRMPALDFIPASALGQPWGVAMLNSEGKVLSSQLPPFPDLNFVPMSFIGQNGGVAELDFTGKVPASQLPTYDFSGFALKSSVGQAGGIAALDEDGKVPSDQLPAFPVTKVNGYTGNVNLTYTDVNADIAGTAITQATNARVAAVAQAHAEIDPLITNLQNNKLDKVDYIQHFRGLFTSYSALTTAIPVGINGDYAHIDSGAGFDRMQAIWDSSDSKWVVNQVNVPHNTDEMPEGSTNLYHTSARVRAVPLTGIDIPTASRDITANDTIMTALAQLQANYKALPAGGTIEDATWVAASTVGVTGANGDANQNWSGIEFCRYKGYLWMRGFYTATVALSAGNRLFTITNNKYKVLQLQNTPNIYAGFYQYAVNLNILTNGLFSNIQVTDATTAANSVQYFHQSVNESGTANAYHKVPMICVGKLADPT